MPRKSEPPLVSEARLRLTQAKKRVVRQQLRVDRMSGAAPNRVRARALLEELRRREHRAARYLRMVEGWWRKHRRSKFPRNIKNRFVGPPKARETVDQRKARWDQSVRTFLDQQYTAAPHYKSCVLLAWEKFLALNMASEHFVTELVSGNKAKILQRVWEMMIARHLDALGFKIKTAAKGPDFRFEHEGRVYWIEAVSPEPMGVPEDYLEFPKPGEFKVGDVPHEEVRRRWITAVDEKAKKLKKYRAKGIVGGNDAYIIAVNGCQLGALPVDHGISGLPYAVEAVYPVGPLAIPIEKATCAFGKPYIGIQWSIKSANGSPVPTSMFVNNEHAGVSAIIASSSDRSEDPILPLDVVHNNCAKVQLGRGIFGTKSDEWVPSPDGSGGINVTKVKPEPKMSAGATEGAQPTGRVAADEDFGERSATDVVAGGTVR